MAICQLCRKERKLIKAHIIPKQLYKPIKISVSNDSSRQVALGVFYPGQDRRPKQVQNGIYDSHILCGECDNHTIGPWDNYAQSLFSNASSLGRYDLSRNDGKKVYVIDDIDYKKLKLFCMSVLWRAAVSRDDFFSRIRIGTWEPQLRGMLISKDPGEKGDFTTIITRYEGDCRLLMSQSRDLSGCPGYYFFRFPDYGFTIKADQASLFTPMNDFIIKPDCSLTMVVQEYLGTYPLPCLS